MLNIVALEKYSAKSLVELENDLNCSTSDKELNVSADCAFLTKVTVEPLTTLDNERLIRRVFVGTKDERIYDKVGWVVNDDISQCMVCSKSFGVIFSHKQHCHACGRVLCFSCCVDGVNIVELEECGGLPAGKCCYWGQDSVSCIPTSTGTDKDSASAFVPRPVPSKSSRYV